MTEHDGVMTDQNGLGRTSEVRAGQSRSEQSATERLRALLDERGVEYRVSATGYSIDIGPNVTAYANRTDTTLDVSLRGFTPEQAVDTTLGPGTCRYEWSLADNGWADHTCSACGFCENTDIHVSLGWNYCPNCGRRVIGGVDAD